LNLIEGWFSVLTRKALTNASFTSTRQLEDAIGFHGVGVQCPVESVDGEGHGAARGAGEVSAFSVDPADGSLTAITGVSELASGYAGLVAV
jgi:hypothetical protein